MKKIIWIAPCAPYDNMPHAGGNNFNYYINYFAKSASYGIYLTGMDYASASEKASQKRKHITKDMVWLDRTAMERVTRRTLGIFSVLNPLSRYDNSLLWTDRLRVLRKLRQYKTKYGMPDIVIFHWTHMGLLMPEVHKIFPESSTVLIEEDVTWQNYGRKAQSAESVFKKTYWKRRYRRMKAAELKIASRADLTVVLNEKDCRLLLREGIPVTKVFCSSPFFENYSGITRTPDQRTLLYYGAMNRPENHESVLWFIERVMPLLPQDMQLYVVGASPPEKLLNKQSANVQVAGFVEDVTPFLERTLCMVAPLIGGAGIKIKVLSAMSAGVPVLTNHIGVEGIPAENGVHYIRCKAPEDYAKSIRMLRDQSNVRTSIEQNARRLMKEKYDVDTSLHKLKARADQLCIKKEVSGVAENVRMQGVV